MQKNPDVMESWSILEVNDLEKNELILIYGTDYLAMTRQLLEKAELDQLIREKCCEVSSDAAEPRPCVKASFAAGPRIGIKPNLVAPVPAEEGATTHPQVVEGLILYLKEHGYENLVIMESSWVGDRTEDAFDLCGYYELADKYQVELLDMKKAAVTEIDCAGMELTVCEPALEVDFLINVPVLKGHCQTRMTCALKNMKGLLPDSQKRAFHRMGLHQPIGHLSAGIRQDFILVDSICGDLSFEDGGNPVQQDRLIAAADPVLCDAWCCHLMQIPVEEVPYIGYAADCGCGNPDPAQAKVTELNEPVRAMDVSFSGKALRLAELAEDVESCSACYGSLIPALNRLQEEGILESLKEKICIGQGYQKKEGMLGVGNCTRHFSFHLPGCPPTEQEMYDFLKNYIKQSGICPYR